MEIGHSDNKSSENYYVLDNKSVGKIIYFKQNKTSTISIPSGIYQINKVDKSTGNINVINLRQVISHEFTIDKPEIGDIYWFKRLADK